ncbi:BtrH N-terminal domain-containing protein [Desulfosarcina ovata]|uniref:Peptidase n=1 Tax=Desulfosarcina ovata subsp. ovata TaxID=2752305 RepID=A0A5K8AEA9_9BACT|nr:BtrH N-terminal domain-containing protein [Desulfosarcina ovata]BBO90324.1 peptidase [Desulfosarcina ovata subsp. ovata]
MTASAPEPIEIDFDHRQSAHCESGVCANLLRHHGIEISEAMAFGIGSGLFFAYLPFIRINGLPLTTYRCEVGGIIKRVTRRLGCRVHWQKFRDPDKAMHALDERLAQGIPVACRTGGYWLPYFPPAFRFHFNMHNLVVCGKAEYQYIISDPVFPDKERCSRRDLSRARFAKGALAPKGSMYFLEAVPDTIDLAAAARQGIREVCRRMLNTPVPLIGIRGIRYLARQVEKWPRKLGEERTVLYIGQLIRMQEELGTGGAGFRFMFAAFLQEAADLLDLPRFLELSRSMTLAGDQWRKFAVIGGRICKGRASADDHHAAMAALLQTIAADEAAVYRELLQLIKE